MNQPQNSITPSASPGHSYAYKASISTGKEWETETDTYYFGARRYDPTIGMWLGMDPVRQFSSLYVYGANNPLSFFDPDGREIEASSTDGATIDELTFTADVYFDHDLSAIPLERRQATVDRISQDIGEWVRAKGIKKVNVKLRIIENRSEQTNQHLIRIVENVIDPGTNIYLNAVGYVDKIGGNEMQLRWNAVKIPEQWSGFKSFEDKIGPDHPQAAPHDFGHLLGFHHNESTTPSAKSTFQSKREYEIMNKEPTKNFQIDPGRVKSILDNFGVKK